MVWSLPFASHPTSVAPVETTARDCPRNAPSNPPRISAPSPPPLPVQIETSNRKHPSFIDPNRPLPHDDAILLPCDLGDPSESQRSSLMGALSNADVLIHFSAVNPYPNANWSESAQTMDHAFNIFQMAVMCKGEGLSFFLSLFHHSIVLSLMQIPESIAYI